MLYLNGQPVPVTMFPDKTSQVWKLPQHILDTEKRVEVRWNFENEGEFMQLAQLKALLDNCGISATLILKYLPYGRQDKPISNAATFALHTFSKLLNSLNFGCVYCSDPHSNFAVMTIKRFIASYPKRQIEQVMRECHTTKVCYPDKGALSKYTKVYDELIGNEYIYGEKVRDQLTGNILSYKVVGECAGENVLIVDDICDGGMTFKLLAKDLLAAGAKSVVLFVTHGIFSRGLQTLKDSGIQKIYTQDGEASEISSAEGADDIIYRKL